MSRTYLDFVSIAAVCCLMPAAAAAQTSQGGGWAFLCSDGKPPAANGSCQRGGAAGSQAAPSAPAVNAAARAAEIERARIKLAQQNQAAAAARIRQAAAAEEQRRIESARQAEFLRERDATARGLKGVGSELDLRDAVRDTPSSQPRSTSTVIRPSQRRALQQAVCALSALKEGLRGEGGTGTSTLSESIGQASSIIDGSNTQQPTCGEPPQWDIPPGVDVDLVVARARAITTTAQGMVQAPPRQNQSRPLTPDEQRIQAAFRAQKQNEQRLRDRDAPAVAVQERINRVQERKFDPRDANAIRREQESRVQLQKYVNAIESLERGQVDRFLDLTDDVDALLGGHAPAKKP